MCKNKDKGFDESIMVVKIFYVKKTAVFFGEATKNFDKKVCERLCKMFVENFDKKKTVKDFDKEVYEKIFDLLAWRFLT